MTFCILGGEGGVCWYNLSREFEYNGTKLTGALHEDLHTLMNNSDSSVTKAAVDSNRKQL